MKTTFVADSAQKVGWCLNYDVKIIILNKWFLISISSSTYNGSFCLWTIMSMWWTSEGRIFTGVSLLMQQTTHKIHLIYDFQTTTVSESLHLDHHSSGGLGTRVRNCSISSNTIGIWTHWLLLLILRYIFSKSSVQWPVSLRLFVGKR